MEKYIDLVKEVLEKGESKTDRTGTGTISLFGKQQIYDLREGFPLVTTKKVHFKSIVHELLWFISGSTNTRYLKDNQVKIWNEWEDEKGNLGPIYGHQWRNWGGKIDQLKLVIQDLVNNPHSRRHIVSSWNPTDIPDMALAPCHCFFQFNVSGNYLDLHLYQRSADLMLGVPFNIASYSLLLHLVAKVTSYSPRNFIHSFGDVHIYNNHIEGAREQITRKPFPLPKIKVNYKPFIDGFYYSDVQLINYKSHPTIKFKVSV